MTDVINTMPGMPRAAPLESDAPKPAVDGIIRRKHRSEFDVEINGTVG